MFRWAGIVLASVSAVDASDIWVVNVGGTSLAEQVAVQTCSGLFNRDESVAGASFVLGLRSQDEQWLADLEGDSTKTTLSVTDYLKKCLTSGVAKGYIRYTSWDGNARQTLPQVITLAGVLDAVVLDDSVLSPEGATLLRDIATEWKDWSELSATQYMFETYASQTTGMSKTNPGWDTSDVSQITDAKITHGAAIFIFDFVVKQKLFNFFLLLGCVPLMAEHTLTETMAANNPWPKPVTVYGYDNTVSLAGSIYEAETKCTSTHNWGQVASDSASNMAFYSRTAPITSPPPQNSETPQSYDASKTYISFIIGDGDNVGYLVSSRRTWMEERVSKCQSGEGCWPLLWSISPHLPYMAPKMLQWYYNEALKTGNDFFVLPPSGHTYSYPSEQSEPDLSNFVKLTEEDAKVIGTTGTVAWEWYDSWHTAMTNYFPKYAANNVVTAGYAVNVPYLMDTLVSWKYNNFNVFGGKFVLFRPHEWRGTTGSSVPGIHDTMLSVADMASQINNYPKGSVTHIYLTSDGGGKLQDLYDLVAAFDSHVEVVSHNVLTSMALAVDNYGYKGSDLQLGGRLEPGEHLRSASGDITFDMQSDGNLVLYNYGDIKWQTYTEGKTGAYAVFQTDYNFVLYDASGSPLWSSGIHSGAARVTLQDDGNLVIYSSAGKALWATGTNLDAIVV